MIKSFLIHSDNAPLTIQKLFSCDNIVNFDYNKSNYSNLDEYISKEFIEQVEVQKPDIIFIKDNLSSNYLELYGLRVAYHIRLTKELEEKRYLPIVILSDIDSHILNNLDSMARILFTKNIFIIKNTKKAIEDFRKTQSFNNFSESEYENKFLNLINVNAPENSTSHSIANEWAIDRWSYLLGIENNETIKTNREKISSMLYFKYLKQKYILDASEIKMTKNKSLTGKLLFIDDKGSDGWTDIVKSYVKKTSNIEFKTLNNEYKDIENIKESVEVSIDEYAPNIILLDLRLLEDKSDSIFQISGVKILEYIKELNPSIPVIMFTASNDSSILDLLYSKGILGYVKKDAPTDKYKASKNGFNKLGTLIKEGMKKKYLQDVWKIQTEILDLNLSYKDENEKINELELSIKMVFDILNSNMPKTITYAMFAIFKCIEIITYLYIEEKYRKAYWKNTNSMITNTGYYPNRKKIDTSDLEHIQNENNQGNNNQGNISVENKIRTIMHEKLDISCDELHSQMKCIVCARNNAMHQDRKYEDKEFCKNVMNREISSKQIIDWFKLLQKILSKINEPSK